jgi:hypothetical protein
MTLGTPPPMGTFASVSPPQYTLVASTAMATGLLCPLANTTGWHMLSAHAPPWHPCPQAPQFSGSLDRSVHIPEQTVPPSQREPPAELAVELLAVDVEPELAELLDAVPELVLAAVDPLAAELLDAAPPVPSDGEPPPPELVFTASARGKS